MTPEYTFQPSAASLSTPDSGEEYGIIPLIVAGVAAGVSVVGSIVKHHQDKKAAEANQAAKQRRLKKEREALEQAQELADMQAAEAEEDATARRENLFLFGGVLMLLGGGLLAIRANSGKGDS